MTPELKVAWIAALRSGEFAKGREKLFDQPSNTYCCLGVLCRVADPTKTPYEFVTEILRRKENEYADFQDDEFPETVQDEIGLPNDVQTDAIRRNDGGDSLRDNPQSFAQIADWLEEVL